MHISVRTDFRMYASIHAIIGICISLRSVSVITCISMYIYMYIYTGIYMHIHVSVHVSNLRVCSSLPVS